MSFEHIKIARQPVVDISNHFFAHEWLYRDFNSKKSVSPRVASSHLLLTLLNKTSHSHFENDTKAFLNIDTKFLATGLIQALPKERFIFDIEASQEFRNRDKKMIRKLYQSGYAFALDNIDLHSNWYEQCEAMLFMFKFLKINITTVEPEYRHELERLKNNHTLIAHKIENMADHDLAVSMPFDYFQGYYIALPDTVEISIIPIELQHVNQLYLMLQNRESSNSITDFISSKSDLKFYFLQFCAHFDLYPNAMGSNMHELVEAIGYLKLADWTLMLIYSKMAKNT